MSDQNITNGLPPEQGLYSPANERDNCGLGFLVNINGEPSHEVINRAFRFLSTSHIVGHAAAIRKRATARAF